MAPKDIVLFLSPGPARQDSLRRGEPLTVGVPLPMGLARNAAGFTALHSDGSTLPVQAAAMERWRDGSLKWVLIDVCADIVPGAVISLRPQAEPVPERTSLVTDRDGVFQVNSGPAVFFVGPKRFPFQDVQINGQSILDVRGTALVVTDPQGNELPVNVTRIELESNGPVRATFKIDGLIGGAPARQLRMQARLHFFSGKASVKFDLTLGNPRRAVHKGGFWELGDAGSIDVKDVAVRVELARAAGGAVVRCSEEPNAPFVTYGTPFVLNQHSSGGENWRSPVHRNRSGDVPLSFRGYRLTAPGVDRTGWRSTPIVQLQHGGCSVSFAMERFWENFPKVIRAEGRALSLHLFPREHLDLHEIQGGEQKTHTFWVSFGDDAAGALDLEWNRNPSRAIPDPEWCCESGVVPFLTPRHSDPNLGYHRLVDSAIEGADSFVAKREAIDEYGWRHFGEVYADREAVLHVGEQKLVSHYNNQYDAIAGLAYQFLRSGNPSWWPLIDDLARHVVDIDIYHTDRDWPKYNHGLFWHTVHYKDAGLSTHRTYPRTEGVYGGGPSAGHLYTTGLMLHHFMTGSPQSRDAVIELATFVIDCDDGTRSVFRWFDRGRTGFATASGTEDYHGPGRAPGNALNALIDAHRLTGDERFLTKAEELIRRCIHPRDDIPARQLLDAERRWFYLMFLQSLGKFLYHKQDIGQIDFMYAYAQASLLSYALWMADHERPYLDHPEILEYPTESWPATDMRKSEVFKWAALHATVPDRDRFLERAAFFFDYSVRTVSSMSTKTLARPVVLFLSHGWSHAAFMAGALPQPISTAAFDFGTPAAFIPQKARVFRRLKVAVALTALAAVGGCMWWFTR
jgi:hypothetical protein